MDGDVAIRMLLSFISSTKERLLQKSSNITEILNI